MATRINPEIPDKRYFTIGEVCTLCDVDPDVLRYWESKYPQQLKAVKRRGNRRYYQRHEVEFALKIRNGEAPPVAEATPAKQSPTQNDPKIPNKKYFTIGEVLELCNVKATVLRDWEARHPELFSKKKRRGYRRYYLSEEVEAIRRIRDGRLPSISNDGSLSPSHATDSTRKNDPLAKKLVALSRKQRALVEAQGKMLHHSVLGKKVADWTVEESDIFTALLMRLYDFYDHIVLTLRAIAQFEGYEVNDDTDMLTFTMDNKILDSTADWRQLTGLRSSLERKYGDHNTFVVDLVSEMKNAVDKLLTIADRTVAYCSTPTPE